MSMTRKDYRVVADSLRQTRPNRRTDPGPYETWRRVRDDLAVELRVANSNFNREKFIDWTELPVARAVAVPF